MNNRIKAIRKSLKFTQKDFAEKLGVKRNTVAQWEIGVNGLSDQVIKSICREFNVNETWLRYGEGEMFKEARAFSLDELAKSKGATELDIEIVKIYLELEPDIRRRAIEHFKKRLAALPDKPTEVEIAADLTPQPLSQPEPTAPDVMAMLAELQRQNAELLRQNEELMRRDAKRAADIEAIKEVDKLNAIASGAWDSIPYSSGSSDTEATEEVGKQKTAHQHDH